LSGTYLIAQPLVDLCRSPDGPRDRQLRMGETVHVLGHQDGWAEVRAARDGYAGYVPEGALGSGPVTDTVTHRVRARATHVYPTPDFKTRERFSLGYGARLCVRSEEGRFSETPHGFVPRAHLAPVGTMDSDPVAVAELHLGTPYLWGGDSPFGIDCSGLVQVGCLACGLACPGDSGPQMESLGTAIPEDTLLQRGDLVFWRGHVAWVVDPQTLLHANAYHMAVAYEPVADAIARIAAQGDGPVLMRKRLSGPAPA
jgi:cell wall-associated NlpC family hydrolase